MLENYEQKGKHKTTKVFAALVASNCILASDVLDNGFFEIEIDFLNEVSWLLKVFLVFVSVCVASRKIYKLTEGNVLERIIGTC